MENDQDIVAIGPVVYGQQNDYQQFARKGITLKSYFLDKNIIEKISPEVIFKARGFAFEKNSDFIFSGMVSGCCFGLRSDFIINSGYLDDRLFLYYEEDILAHIISKSKKKCMICSSSKVLHNQGRSTEKTTGSGKAAFVRLYRWTSVLYVLWKYGEANRTICYIIGGINIIIWGILSILDKNYRKLYKKFIFEVKRVMKKS